MSLLNSINDLVKSLDFKLHLFISLCSWSSVNSVSEEPVKVIVYASLVNSHNVWIELVFSLSQDHFSLSSSGFLSFSSSSVLLSHVNHCSDSSFLFESDELVRKGAHSVSNDFSLETFCNSIKDSFLIILDNNSFFIAFSLSSPFISNSQFCNQIKSFFLSFKHFILNSSSS